MIRRIIIGLFILLIFGTAIFLLYRSGFREGNVIFKIEAPDQVSSGEEIEYRLIIENRNNFDLNNTKLSLSYPGGTIWFNKEGQPSNSAINNIDSAGFQRRERKEFILRAILTGEKGEIKKIKAEFTYSPSGIKPVFQKSAEAGTTISKVSIPLTLSGPPNVLPGQLVQISLDLRNETEDDFKDLEVVFSYPDGFIFKKASFLPNQSNNVFNLSLLKSGEGVRITIEGNVSGFEKESKRFIAALKRKIDGKFFDFQKTQVLLTVSSPLLALDVLVNDSKDYIAKAGDNLKYKIIFSNNSDNNFSALELSVKLEGQMFDLVSLKTSGFFDQNSRTILWNAAAEPALANLSPNQRGEVSFDINLKPDFPKAFGKNYSLKAGSSIQTSSVPPDFNLDKITALAELITKVKSKTDFISKAFYNDLVFSNTGPVPPQVGQKTTYTIHWKIVNEGNDLTNVRIVSSLLPGISWENKFKIMPIQSDLNYSLSTGQISWSVPTVPAGTGIVSPVFEAVFQVGVTPSVNQSGQNLGILKEVVFEAVDNFTKEKINLSQPGINTQFGVDSPGTVQP
ncbi:MAG: hypothetical protein AAB584_01430 [Patescibacteria group bacterium]